MVYFFSAGVLFRIMNAKFWPILSHCDQVRLYFRECKHFLVYFLQAHIMWWCIKIDKYGVCLFMIMMKPHPQLHQAVLQGDDAGTKHPLHPHLQTSYITCSEGGHTQDIPRNHFTEVESPVTKVHMKGRERPKCETPIFERY